MKKLLIDLGKVIAILLMLTPLVIVSQYEYLEVECCLILLICSILYDIYMYSVISHSNDIQNAKEYYYNYIKDADKKLNLKLTDKEKLETLENYIEDYFEKNTSK